MVCRAAILLAFAVLVGCSSGNDTTPVERIFEVTVYHHPNDFQGSALRRIDPSTLLPVGPSLRLGDYVNSRVLSPDRRTMAFGTTNYGEIVLVDLATMTRRAIRVTKARLRSVWVLSWPGRRTLVAVSCLDGGKWGCSETRLWVLDPESPGTRRATLLPALPQGDFDPRTRRTLLLFSGSRRLIVVEPDGALRGLNLRFPATSLATESGRARAIAVGPRVPVVALDLRTLRISSRRVRGLDPKEAEIRRDPPRQWSGTVNPHETSYRDIADLGGGRFLVRIQESRLTPGHRAVHELARHALLDARRWRSSPAPTRTWIEPAAGLLLANTRSPGRRSFPPFRLVALEPDGDIRYRLDGRAQGLFTWQIGAGLLYGGRIGGGMTHVFDLATGDLLREIPPRELEWQDERPAFRWTPPEG